MLVSYVYCWYTLDLGRITDSSMQSMAHWGSSAITGRGLIALVGQGQVYSVELKQGEQYIVHPR